jgi:hypothetical protein
MQAAARTTGTSVAASFWSFPNRYVSGTVLGAPQSTPFANSVSVVPSPLVKKPTSDDRLRAILDHKAPSHFESGGES